MCFCFPDNGLNKLYWPGEYAATASDSELTGGDRAKMEGLANHEPIVRDPRLLSDDRTKESVTVLLPSLPNFSAHPHKGKLIQTSEL